MTLERNLKLTADWANLDFLRSVAVLLVLADHLWEALGFTEFSLANFDLGRLGVLLFFVHTSLVLMLSLERSDKSRSSPFLDFYIRRAFRIYPLSIVTVLAVVILQVPFGYGQPAIPASGLNVLSNLALIQNLTAAPSVIGPLWSLPLEVQMYAVLPILYSFARRYTTYRVVLLGASLSVLALVFQYVAPRIHGLGLWRISIISFVPCFMAGILAYSLSRRRQLLTLPSWLWPLVLISLVMVYLLWQSLFPVLPDRHRPYRGWVICWLIGVLVPQFRDLELPWLRTACHAVAKYSYGIYLGQVIAIWIGFHLCAQMPPVYRCLISVLALSVMAFGAYHTIEHPGMSVGKRVAQRLDSTPRAVRETVSV